MPMQKQDDETPWDSAKQRKRKQFNRMTREEQLNAIADRGYERKVFKDRMPPGWRLPDDLRHLDHSEDVELKTERKNRR